MSDENNAEQRIPFIIPSDSPRVYATGAFGGFTPHDFRIILFSEVPLEQDAILDQSELGLVREVQAEVILSPLAAKQLSDWLLKQIKKYEETMGEIKLPPTKKDKLKSEENIEK